MKDKMTIEMARELLGLGENYTKNDINQSYREMAKIYHSDNGTTGDEEKFKLINEAKSVLMASLLDANFKNANAESDKTSYNYSSSGDPNVNEDTYSNTYNFEEKYSKMYTEDEPENLSGYEKNLYFLHDYDFNFFGKIPYSYKNTMSVTRKIIKSGCPQHDVATHIYMYAFSKYMHERYPDDIIQEANRNSANNAVAAILSNIFKTFPVRHKDEIDDSLERIDGVDVKETFKKNKKKNSDKMGKNILLYWAITIILCIMGGLKAAYLVVAPLLLVCALGNQIEVSPIIPVIMIFLFFFTISLRKELRKELKSLQDAFRYG